MLNPRGELTYFCFVTEKLFSAGHLLRDITMLKVKLEVKNTRYEKGCRQAAFCVIGGVIPLLWHFPHGL